MPGFHQPEPVGLALVFTKHTPLEDNPSVSNQALFLDLKSLYEEDISVYEHSIAVYKPSIGVHQTGIGMYKEEDLATAVNWDRDMTTLSGNLYNLVLWLL